MFVTANALRIGFAWCLAVLLVFAVLGPIAAAIVTVAHAAAGTGDVCSCWRRRSSGCVGEWASAEQLIANQSVVRS